MVKLKKSPLPEGVTITKDEDYRSQPVFSLLCEDCYNKCYICEDKIATSINVEHIVAHRGNTALKYNWDNLLLSCAHCNKAKNAHYSDIINCLSRDPEEALEISIELFPKTLVTINLLADDAEAQSTKNLLLRVFNSQEPSILSWECVNLRRRLQKELRSFQDLIWEYSEAEVDSLKSLLFERIKAQLSTSSPFAAFKRGILRKFKDSLDQLQDLLASYKIKISDSV